MNLIIIRRPFWDFSLSVSIPVQCKKIKLLLQKQVRLWQERRTHKLNILPGCKEFHRFCSSIDTFRTRLTSVAPEHTWAYLTFRHNVSVNSTFVGVELALRFFHRLFFHCNFFRLAKQCVQEAASRVFAHVEQMSEETRARARRPTSRNIVPVGVLQKLNVDESN